MFHIQSTNDLISRLTEKIICDLSTFKIILFTGKIQWDNHSCLLFPFLRLNTRKITAVLIPPSARWGVSQGHWKTRLLRWFIYYSRYSLSKCQLFHLGWHTQAVWHQSLRAQIGRTQLGRLICASCPKCVACVLTPLQSLQLTGVFLHGHLHQLSKSLSLKKMQKWHSHSQWNVLHDVSLQFKTHFTAFWDLHLP